VQSEGAEQPRRRNVVAIDVWAVGLGLRLGPDMLFGLVGVDKEN
jgi:hypothetical protein